MITVQQFGPLLEIVLDRAAKRNALSPSMLEELTDVFDGVIDRTEVRTVLLRAAGPVFCAGFDLTGRYAEGLRPTDPWTDREHLRRMTRFVEAAWNCPLPIVAAVQGPALAGGADLLLHVDFVIMADDAHLAYPPTRFLGTPPSHMWVSRVGVGVARRVLLGGETLDAQGAMACGLALSTVSPVELEGAARSYALGVAEAGRELLMSNKWLINRSIDLAGRSLLNRMAESEDALAHQSAASRAFKERVAQVGVRDALPRPERAAPMTTPTDVRIADGRPG